MHDVHLAGTGLPGGAQSRPSEPTGTAAQRGPGKPSGPGGLGNPGGPEVIDLFAGAGGLSLGLGAAGFTIAAAVERDSSSCQTFRARHPDAKVLGQDIATVDFRPMRGDFAVVAGGPPCQPFSIGGKRMAAEDPRNGLPQFARAIDELAPAAFVLENVAGLVTSGKKPYFLAMLQQLGSLGYSVQWAVLQAAEYGVPQLRRRLFLVGTRQRQRQHRRTGPSGADCLLPLPTRGASTGAPLLGAGSVLDLDRPLGTPNTAIVTYARRPTLRPSPYHGHLYNGGGRPIDLARPAPTLLASMGGNKTPWLDTLDIVPAYHAHLTAGGRPREGLVPGARRITVQEAAALQGFPAGTFFAGSTSSQYRQVGNAVPPLLAEHVGRALLRHLEGWRPK